MDGQSRFPRQRTSSGAHSGPGPRAASRVGRESTGGRGSPAGGGAPARWSRRRPAPRHPTARCTGGSTWRSTRPTWSRSAPSGTGCAPRSATGGARAGRHGRAALVELVTNALLHTGQGALFDAVLTADLRLRIEVQDGAGRLPGRRRDPEAEYATSGRGLVLVEALADAWGAAARGRQGDLVRAGLALIRPDRSASPARPSPSAGRATEAGGNASFAIERNRGPMAWRKISGPLPLPLGRTLARMVGMCVHVREAAGRPHLD